MKFQAEVRQGRYFLIYSIVDIAESLDIGARVRAQIRLLRWSDIVQFWFFLVFRQCVRDRKELLQVV